ncbi:MAG: DUF402 domain-containing protein [Ardenticatenaceae bacterium]|nr:DUF402 domain-containing protein [Ardenticatenaceae bacterium]
MTITHRPYTENKVRLSGERLHFTCELLEQRPDRVVLRHILPGPGRVGDVELPAGTVTFGYYWPARPYNVYHWLHPDGTTLAHYFNLSGPVTVEENQLEWQDLVIDVLVTPDGRVQLLDEDELPSWLEDDVRAHIAWALGEVMATWPSVVHETETITRQLLRQLEP